jgi:hypothetical protein
MNDLTKKALAALLSVAAKEFLTQFGKWLKAWKVTRKFLQTLGGMIRSHSLFLYLDSALALFSAWQTYLSVISPEPVTRGSIFAISFSTGLVFFWLREFFHDLRVYRVYIEEPPEEDAARRPADTAPTPGAAAPRSLAGRAPIGLETEPAPPHADAALPAPRRERRKRP